MRKGMLLGFGVLLIGVFILVGCGQQNPTVNTANTRPVNLTIRGTVFTTTLAGVKGDPISGATVVISGALGTYRATTSANGEYTLSDIPDGDYRLIVTAEGHTRISTANPILKPQSGIPADGTITVQDITLTSNPIISSYSPVPTSVITANQTFVVTFNETMDATSVTPTLTAAGIRTMVIPNAGDVAITTTWDGAYKQLTIVPKAALISNESYTLTINSTGLTGARDTTGFLLSTIAEQANAATATYRVGTGTGLPGDPTNLAIVYNTTTECDYNRVFNNAGTLFLSWVSPTTGGPVTGYNVYVAYGASGNFVKMNATPLTANQYTMTTDGSGNDIILALYGAGSVRNPVCTGGFPFINDQVRFKVVALNGDGESATGATISARDILGPSLALNGALRCGQIASTYPNTYLNSGILLTNIPTGTNIGYISFNEPLGSIVSASSFHIGAETATSAVLIKNHQSDQGFMVGNTNARAIVQVTVPSAIVTTTSVTVDAGAVTDLSGNTNIQQLSTIL